MDNLRQLPEFVTLKDLSLIEAQTAKVQAEWWCLFNKWEWPEQMPDEAPQGKMSEYNPNNRRSNLMGVIESKIGHKACNREWNIERMTDEEHEEWWEGGRLPRKLTEDDE